MIDQVQACVEEPNLATEAPADEAEAGAGFGGDFVAPEVEKAPKLSLTMLLTFTNFLKDAATLCDFQEVCELGARTASSLTGTGAAMVWITAPGAIQ